ncbi:TIR domain-containing protein [uncultured Kordia sp.]|uniref:TIR domain-containing protein n=1 Tax=uncultured Kordia sp. TaxID=507699 RepID=UPI00263290D8|nr:TIR domain-containing protein [uncultured Kordia sp.]
MKKRKTFISYYHKDEDYKNKFEELFEDIIVNKSVRAEDIDVNNHDQYTKELIQKDYLKDVTVLVVLISQKTRCRKHVDWEIAAALNHKVGGIYAGLVGIRLPSHSDYGLEENYNPNNIPDRLADNLKKNGEGYASIHDWTEDIEEMKDIINNAFYRRTSHEDERVNSKKQMDKNLCN